MAPRVVGFVWDGWVLHIGAGAQLDPCVRSAVQLALGLGEPVTIQTEDGARVQAPCVVVGANVAHAFEAGGFAMLWLEPHSDAARRLGAAYTSHAPITTVELPGAAALAERATELLYGSGDCDEAWQFTADWLGAATGELPRGPVVHPAIRKALRIIAQCPQFKVSAREFAAAVELSESRLTHVFREHMGMPLRRFLMWQRVREAALRIAKGMPASEVAQEVGFTDSAHLTRSFKMMLGMRPSDLQNAPPATLRICTRPD